MKIPLPSSRRYFLVGGICLLLAFWSAAAYAQPRVVAIGDVHGAYPEFVRILQRTGLIDANRRWIGGSATLVQLGDVVDRGKEGPACLDLLMDLERQAAKARGRVIPLLGNHEVMNIMGDLRYVPPEMWHSFATDRSEKVRDRAYQDYLKFLSADRNHARAAASADPESERKKWMEDHPPGFFEYRDAFGPDGKYGRWVRQHPAIVQIGGGVFVHAGLNPSLQFRDVADLAEGVRKELAAFDSLWQALSEKQVIWRYMRFNEALDRLTEEAARMESHEGGGDPETLAQIKTLLGLRSWLCVSSDGPLWYRGLAVDPEETLASGVQTMLERLKAQYLVVGHTVQANSQIGQRFDHRVFLIDTGMNGEAFGGTASALQIEGGRFTAYYANRDPIILISRRPICNFQEFPAGYSWSCFFALSEAKTIDRLAKKRAKA
jgi:hypothetical protein